MKALIVYFSWSNNTKNLIENINKEFNYDVIRIERKIPYSSNYNQCAYVEAKEEYEKKILPEIKSLNVNFNLYDKILLFFPIWWYTFPMPIGTFIKTLSDFKGEIVLFENSYTNDIQYAKNSLNDAIKINNKLIIKNGLFNKTAKEHIEFIKKELN